MKNTSKIIQYIFYGFVTIGTAYRLINPSSIPEEFNVSISSEEHALNVKYLSGMRDEGYKLDRELKDIGVRDEKD